VWGLLHLSRRILFTCGAYSWCNLWCSSVFEVSGGAAGGRATFTPYFSSMAARQRAHRRGAQAARIASVSQRGRGASAPHDAHLTSSGVQEKPSDGDDFGDVSSALPDRDDGGSLPPLFEFPDFPGPRLNPDNDFREFSPFHTCPFRRPSSAIRSGHLARGAALAAAPPEGRAVASLSLPEGFRYLLLLGMLQILLTFL